MHPSWTKDNLRVPREITKRILVMAHSIQHHRLSPIPFPSYLPFLLANLTFDQTHSEFTTTVVIDVHRGNCKGSPDLARAGEVKAMLFGLSRIQDAIRVNRRTNWKRTNLGDGTK